MRVHVCVCGNVGGFKSISAVELLKIAVLQLPLRKLHVRWITATI